MLRFIIGSLFVLFVFLIFELIGALTFPVALTLNGNLLATGQDLLVISVQVLLTSALGFFLGKMIHGIKLPTQGMILACISPFLIGGVTALFPVLNFAYSAHVNLYWLGGNWYSPWITMFLIGSPIMMIFLV
jgi:hypothetical protein